VIGGLPRTRLPLMAGLILVTLGLLVAATLLIRRERAVAQLRSEFVSRVSHELRTPLTQIRMFAETLLLGRVRSADESRRALEIIDRESRRLTHLVENILQFSRGERGTTTLSKLPRDLAPLVRELVAEFEPLVQDEQIKMVTSLGDAVAPVDEDAFRQVLLNLLDNAVKYGPTPQQIDIATERINGVVRVSVDDEGPSVPKGEREHIWQRYYRLDREQETASAGTGIGLAVVRELVSLHGGRTWVEVGSRGGSRFVVELPAAESEDAR
jgi:signal transduction histidine kinase